MVWHPREMSWAEEKAAELWTEVHQGEFARDHVLLAILATVDKCAEVAKELVREKFDGSVEGDDDGWFVQQRCDEIGAAIRKLGEP